jgi:hypothetical protein
MSPCVLFVLLAFPSPTAPHNALVAGDICDASRPLPLLQTLKVQGWPYGPFGGICFSQQDLHLLVQCFSGLRDLRLGAAVEPHADLSPLVQLQQLTALTVSFDLDATTAQGLAVITGLRRLTIYTACLPAVALLWLAKLQKLNQLDIYATALPAETRV